MVKCIKRFALVLCLSVSVVACATTIPVRLHSGQDVVLKKKMDIQAMYVLSQVKAVWPSVVDAMADYVVTTARTDPYTAKRQRDAFEKIDNAVVLAHGEAVIAFDSYLQGGGIDKAHALKTLQALGSRLADAVALANECGVKLPPELAGASALITLLTS